MIKFIHPALFFFIGIAFLPFVRGKALKGLLLVVPALSFLAMLRLTPGVYGEVNYLGINLILGRVDALSLVFAHIFTLMALLGFLYAMHGKDRIEHAMALLYVGSALGVAFAGDYLTLFIFWEMMGPPSTFLVWLRRKRESLWAGFRYLLVHAAGGLILLAGIVLHYKATGSLSFESILPATAGLPEYLILIGIALNAAVVPLHAWLPDAYPTATVAGTVFMASYTTKVALYALARGFGGFSILIPFGVLTALCGVAYATIENDGRKILACHIVSQMGYMVVGVGIGTKLGIDAACAHAYANILFKGLLLMATGAVLYQTGRSKLNELGGLFKTMPLTLIFCVIGGLAISGFPFTNGFISKGMVLQAAKESGHLWAMLFLFLAAIGTFLSVGLKLPYFTFFAEDKNIKAKEPPWNMRLAMALTAFFCIFHGSYPASFLSLLPYPVEYHAYVPHHLVETMQILLFTGLGFYFLHRKLKPEPKLNLDVDWFYRKGARAFIRLFAYPLEVVDNFVSKLYATAGLRGLMATAWFSAWFDKKGIDGVVDGTAYGVKNTGGFLRKVQTGKLNQYAALAVIFFFVILTVSFWRRW